MKLQIALDLMTSAEVMEIADRIHDIIDIIEIGTPLILREGLSTVTKLKTRYPDILVLADTKIVDGGKYEAADAFEAGADIVTVLAVSADETIGEVVQTAQKYHRETMADLICVQDIPQRALHLQGLGVDYLCVHTAVDVQDTGKTPYADLAELVSVLTSAKAAVAGGVNIDAVPALRETNPAIVVAGSSLTKAPDLRAAVIEMSKAIK